MQLTVFGWQGAILEVLLFFLMFNNVVSFSTELQQVNPIISYWLGFTVLTGFWEIVYLSNRDSINLYSSHLVKTKESVWTNEYGLSMVLPWNLSKLFYAEYGAWADREYMILTNYWSRLIEGSHAFLCGLVALHCMLDITEGEEKTFLILATLSMGTQLMNSILYMGEYFIQTREHSSTNFNSLNFPTGFLLTKRGFMYVNLLWTIMPSYCIYSLLSN